MTALDYTDEEPRSGVRPRGYGLPEATVVIVLALYALASRTVLDRRLACSVLIREIADELAAGEQVSGESMARIRAMEDDAAALAVRIIEGGAAEATSIRRSER